MATKIFIDGKAGTTGLQIEERFSLRKDVTILSIDPALRKDAQARRDMIAQADIVFLCLPDAAAREAVALAEGTNARIIDASTAHRTNPAWAYGFPELSQAHRQNIAQAKCVAVPGCHATGFISTVYPMVQLGILPKEYPLVCHSITGYSGGGNAMIAQYEAQNRPNGYDSPRQYGLGLCHKHLPEMQAVTGISFAPVFNPIVADYYKGMAVSVPLHNRLLNGKPTATQIHAALSAYYAQQTFVEVVPFMGAGVLDDNFLAANTLAGTNRLQIFVCGNDEQTTLVARFDNLGKGASGAAVQCMNIMLGLDETTGLR